MTTDTEHPGAKALRAMERSIVPFTVDYNMACQIADYVRGLEGPISLLDARFLEGHNSGVERAAQEVEDNFVGLTPAEGDFHTICRDIRALKSE